MIKGSYFSIVLIAIVLLSCKKQEKEINRKDAILGKWYWEKQEYTDHITTDFNIEAYFSFDENDVFIEFNGHREINGKYKLSENGDTLYTKRDNYDEVKWMIRTLTHEYLVIEIPGSYKYTLSKKLGIPNSFIETTVKDIIGKENPSIVPAAGAHVFIFDSYENLLANKPAYQAATNSSGTVKIKVPDRTGYYLTVSKGKAGITTSDGFLIQGVFTENTSQIFYEMQSGAKIGDLIKMDANGDGMLSDEDKKNFYRISSGQKSEVKSLQVYIAE